MHWWVLGCLIAPEHAALAAPPNTHPSVLPADDIWSLDLAKLDGWKCVRENTVGEEAFRELGSDEWETGSEEDQGEGDSD
jgi:hypothetical protein